MSMEELGRNNPGVAYGAAEGARGDDNSAEAHGRSSMCGGTSKGQGQLKTNGTRKPSWLELTTGDHSSWPDEACWREGGACTREGLDGDTLHVGCWREGEASSREGQSMAPALCTNTPETKDEDKGPGRWWASGETQFSKRSRAGGSRPGGGVPGLAGGRGGRGCESPARLEAPATDQCPDMEEASTEDRSPSGAEETGGTALQVSTLHPSAFLTFSASLKLFPIVLHLHQPTARHRRWSHYHPPLLSLATSTQPYQPGNF